jgi:hypothetical protein
MAFASTAPVALGKIHEDSHVTVNSKLDNFKVPPTETSETGGQWITVQPLTNNASSQLQLVLPASDEYYTDLENSYIILEYKVTKQNGDNLGDEPKVYIAENGGHSFFERETYALNTQDVDHNSCYAQTAYFRTLIDESSLAKAGRLTGEGWVNDGTEGKNFADLSPAQKEKRHNAIKNGKTVSVYMRPFSALDRQPRALPPGISIRLTFSKAQPKTYIIGPDDTDAKVEITKFLWMVRRVVVNPSIVRAQSARLVEGNTYKFPLRKHRTRVHTIPKDVMSHRIVIDQDDIVPNRILLGMVTHEAFVGTYKLSPFKYSPHNLTGIELTVDGVSVGGRLEMDFPGKNYAHAYAHTLAALGQLTTKKGNGITYGEFGTNKTVFAWCTATDLPNKDRDQYFHLRRKGCTAVVFQFSTVTPEPISVLVCDEREDLLELDLENRVKTVTGVV